jgi:non-ribosomal peptide synthetase component F
VLVLVVHHIVVDAWSMGVMVGELAGLYNSFRLGLPSSLPSLRYQYADYAVWQRSWLDGERLGRQLDYWRRRLQAVPVLALPTDYPRPAAPSSTGAQLTFQFPTELSTALHRLCREEGVTVFMALLAAFKTVLSHYSGQTDIAVGTPVAGRSRPELEQLIGFFVNTLVLRTDLSGRPTFRQLLARVRDTALGAFDHQDVPFERLVQDLQPDRNLDRTPLFQVMFGLQNAPVHTIDLDHLQLTTHPIDTHSSMFELLLIVNDDPDTINGLITYRTDLYHPDTITTLTTHLQQLLHTTTTNPNSNSTVAIDTPTNSTAVPACSCKQGKADPLTCPASSRHCIQLG